ncbi:hypothetical protein Lrub_1950 [Legionella rubrilucens]|uniref:Uncharacterized protein n=2 Tax=Legionella rubrilucens TaxID=458 RepID=A0A0W0XR60_9GAMM|nr:hypothetical protein Lrub_1950 [Legionella rubrilucens]
MSKHKTKKGQLSKEHLKQVSGGQHDRRPRPPILIRPEPTRPAQPGLPPLTRVDE